MPLSLGALAINTPSLNSTSCTTPGGGEWQDQTLKPGARAGGDKKPLQGRSEGLPACLSSPQSLLVFAPAAGAPGICPSTLPSPGHQGSAGRQKLSGQVLGVRAGWRSEVSWLGEAEWGGERGHCHPPAPWPGSAPRTSAGRGCGVTLPPPPQPRPLWAPDWAEGGFYQCLRPSGAGVAPEPERGGARPAQCPHPWPARRRRHHAAR